VRVAIATAASLAGSLAADTILVAIGEAVFPSTKGYGHFQFSDYAKLTVIGVLIACVAWPVVTRISSSPRWLFFRMAILVTLVLWLPDLYILHGGAPPRAVAVLMVMHLAIALVTYNCLVHIAGVGPEGAAGRPRPAAHRHARPGNLGRHIRRTRPAVPPIRGDGSAAVGPHRLHWIRRSAHPHQDAA
jgi:hypothetical protein